MTSFLCCWKWSFCQLCHNHCPCQKSLRYKVQFTYIQLVFISSESVFVLFFFSLSLSLSLCLKVLLIFASAQLSSIGGQLSKTFLPYWTNRNKLYVPLNGTFSLLLTNKSQQKIIQRMLFFNVHHTWLLLHFFGLCKDSLHWQQIIATNIHFSIRDLNSGSMIMTLNL